MSNNLDKLFRKALEDQRCTPSPDLWQAIERRMDQRRKRRQIILWGFRGAAAVLLAIGSLWVLRMHTDIRIDSAQLAGTLSAGTDHNIVNARPETMVYPKTIKGATSGFSDISGNTAEAGTAVISEKQHQPMRQSLPDTEGIASIGLENLSLNPSETITLAANTEPKDFVPIVSKEALQNAREYHALLEEAPASAEKHRKIKVTVSGHVAPVYSSGTYNSSLSNRQGRSYSQKELNGMANAAGGLKVAVATSPKLSWQTGISYSRIGQRSGSNTPAPRTMLLADENIDNYCATPLGNIKGQPQATAYRSPGAMLLSNNGSGETEQDFGTLEIPLSVRYRLNDNKVKFFVSGGLCGNIIVSNKVYQDNGNEREHLGSTEDIRNFNVSTDFSVGAEYPLARRVKIMLEPGFKYYLQSLSRDSRVNFKPYLFSLSTGIGIEF